MDDDEGRPRPPTTHQIGASLDALSVSELDERILLLREEIARLEAARSAKRSARDAASSVFGRPSS